MPTAALPDVTDYAAFDALHDDPSAWRAAIVALAAELGTPEAEVRQESEGTVLVAHLGDDRVLKVYPPFLRDHFEFESATLGLLHGRLTVPTPKLLASSERHGWPWLLMRRMQGDPLTATWPAMSEAERCALLHDIGALINEVHTLPATQVESMAAHAPPWHEFIARQRAQCVERHRRHGLPADLLADLPAFVAGPLPEGPPVLLTGEYTPFNLFTQANRLNAMFDFGDGLVGPREYDWLGPQCFLVAGDAGRSAALMRGLGVTLTDERRLALMRLLLLHRYSHLKAQVKIEGWEHLRSFEEIAARLWPLP